jgi:UDP-N-acetylmuramate dehydrogenase
MRHIQALAGALQKARVGEIRLEERLSNYTTMGTGGPCRALVRPPDIESLERLIKVLGDLELMYLPVGGGSNLLVADEGFDGVIIATEALQEWDEFEGFVLRAGAGVATARIVKWASSRNLTGLEGLAGVPGSIGGACVMNAGGRGGNIEESLVGVEVVTAPPAVHVVTVAAEALNLAYRSSSLPAGSVIGRVELSLEEGEKPNIVSETIQELLSHRRETQPVSVLSVGSVFKNPAGDSAGRLIDDCGLKGLREGDAVVSDVHANYVVNTGGATATQIRTLIDRIRDSVETLTGIKLELEVVPVGFEGDPVPAMAWIPPKSRMKDGRR